LAPHVANDANVLLYLSNEGESPVDLAVYVDGRLAVQREMRSLYPVHGAAHGNPEEVPLAVAGGPHVIRVVARMGTVSAESHFVVSSGKVYVSATYWPLDTLSKPATPAKIEIRIQDRRFGWC
jgi:hypothetical protein